MVTYASACVRFWTNNAKRGAEPDEAEDTSTGAGRIATSPTSDSSAAREQRRSSYSPKWYPPTGGPAAGDPLFRSGGRGSPHGLYLPLSKLADARCEIL